LRQDLGLVDWILIVGVLLGVLYLAAMATRRAAIRLPGGTVECSLRRDGDDRWRTGVAAYRADQLCWFRSRGVDLRPDAAFDRHSMQLLGRRDGGRDARSGDDDSGGQADAIEVPDPPGAAAETVVVRFATGDDGHLVWLAMSNDALTGLLAWLEAGPPYLFPSAI
jgi:hypothetical protein